METDSQSVSFNNGRLREASEDEEEEDDFELLWRKCFRDFEFEENDDDDVVLWFISVLELVVLFWYSFFFSPRRSFHLLEHLGALGENKYGSVLDISISVLRRDFAHSGDRISNEVRSLTEGLTDES